MKKRREEWLHARTAGEVSAIRLSLDPSTGNVSYDTPVDETYVDVSYHRAKGPKTVCRTPIHADELQLDTQSAIEENFDILFAIDTNTRNVDRQHISATGVVECRRVFAVDTTGSASSAWQFRLPICFEFTDAAWSPERVGWQLGIDHIEQAADYADCRAIGIVIDSELGLLGKFNARVLPVVKDRYLPDRMTLLYASADTGSDLLPNRALSHADSAARQCLRRPRSGTRSSCARERRGPFFSSLEWFRPDVRFT